MSKKLGLLFLAGLFISISSFAYAGEKVVRTDDIDIPFTKFVLPNGLTLIVHEDHKAPIVALNVWYHVGSKNEKVGKTGFAHLFEHLMFNGSEHYNDDYIKVMEKIGATDLNGTTSNDRTNYFEDVPTSALDMALWMESDRMGHLLGVLDQKKLDEQRGVVQNEKRQGENEPYAISEELITKNTYPSGHPYSWTVIGSMEDLNAASLEDVKEWFKTYYGAANAVLAVAGDVNPDLVFEKVKKYFGDVPSGPPVAKQNLWIAKRTGMQRQQAQDRVPQSRIYKVWNVPETGSADADLLGLVGNLLSSGKTSRLYKRLVYDDQIATDVSAYVDRREIGSQFYIEATAKPGGDLSKVERAIDEELSIFLKSGPTGKELKRVVTQFEANFVRGIERIGGFGGKSDILARNQVFKGDPGYYKVTLNRVRNATPEEVLSAARTWLSDGVYVLEIHPFGEFTSAPTDSTIRNKIPDVAAPPDAHFPPFHRSTLSNGMNIVLAERRSIPLVNLVMVFDAGSSSDQFSQPGTANLAMSMMDEGTTRRNALAISEDLAMLGASLGTGSNLDASFVWLNTLKTNLDAALDIYADVILHPSFPQEDFERLQKQTLARIQQEKVEPISMGLRVFPKLLYGEGHAYSNPLTGSGTEQSVGKMMREDMVKFHATWIRPNNATLVVVGATTMDEIKPKLEKLFEDWKTGDVPKKNLSTVELGKQSVYLIDKPGAVTSIILAGHITVPKNNPDEVPIEAMNTVLGGAFSSRINMNLREDKHWSYGSGSVIMSARGQRPFIAYGIVQTDKTKESMVEMNKEMREILGKRPATQDELGRVQGNLTLQLPGSWETNSAVSSTIEEMVQYAMPDDYYDTYAQKIRNLSVSNITDAAKKVLHPDNIVWVVVGDRTKIEGGIRELGYGDIHLIDSDGNPR
ncbi:MAG: pitrilysin family protein [Bacteroidota bacterium]|jgi:zinc protease